MLLHIFSRPILDSFIIYNRQFSLNNVHNPELGKEYNAVPMTLCLHLEELSLSTWGMSGQGPGPSFL